MQKGFGRIQLQRIFKCLFQFAKFSCLQNFPNVADELYLS